MMSQSYSTCEQPYYLGKGDITGKHPVNHLIMAKDRNVRYLYVDDQLSQHESLTRDFTSDLGQDS